jgi:hypothetical protein
LSADSLKNSFEQYLYPNPARTVINIKAVYNIKSFNCLIFKGRIIQTILENKNTTTIDISGCNKRIYFLQINTRNGIEVEKNSKRIDFLKLKFNKRTEENFI